jgi:hypothetical protein
MLEGQVRWKTVGEASKKQVSSALRLTAKHACRVGRYVYV